MLKQQTLFLQNKLVFKVVVMLLCAAFLFWQLPISYNEQNYSAKMLESANEKLQNTREKVAYAEDYKDLVDTTYKIFSETIHKKEPICALLNGYYDKYQSLSEKFRLHKPAHLRISEISEISKVHDSNYINILSNDVDLKFTSKGFRHAVSFIKSAYLLLPHGSLVEALRIEEEDVITPNLIDQLNTKAHPQLIESQVSMKVREVNINSSGR